MRFEDDDDDDKTPHVYPLYDALKDLILYTGIKILGVTAMEKWMNNKATGNIYKDLDQLRADKEALNQLLSKSLIEREVTEFIQSNTKNAGKASKKVWGFFIV